MGLQLGPLGNPGSPGSYPQMLILGSQMKLIMSKNNCRLTSGLPKFLTCLLRYLASHWTVGRENCVTHNLENQSSTEYKSASGVRITGPLSFPLRNVFDEMKL